MHIMVHIKQKIISVAVGDGGQPMKWLANVGQARYDESQGRHLGTPAGVKLQNGTVVSLSTTLAEAGLQDLQHIYVSFRSNKPAAGGKKGKAAPPTSDNEDDF